MFTGFESISKGAGDRSSPYDLVFTDGLVGL
jgi:hypothetical protein